jgi:hypothetical protein
MKLVKATEVKVGDTIFYMSPENLFLGAEVTDIKYQFGEVIFYGTNEALVSCREKKRVAILERKTSP